MSRRVLTLLLALGTASATPPPAILRDVAYGPDAAQKLDLYQAPGPGPTPVAVYIHGGGWLRGDKSSVADFPYQRLLESSIAVISISYRYCPARSPDGRRPPVSIPLGDAARAIQFIRSRSGEWRLNKARLGIWGASAGACTGLWLATHRDLAEPSAVDPVERESSRPWCLAAINAQTTLDPRQMRAWVGPDLTYGAHAFGLAIASNSRPGFERFLAARERLRPWIKEYSPAALLGRGAPPIFLDYPTLGLSPAQPNQDYYNHSPRYGLEFKALADRAGDECHLHYAGGPAGRWGSWMSFLIAKLKE